MRSTKVTSNILWVSDSSTERRLPFAIISSPNSISAWVTAVVYRLGTGCIASQPRTSGAGVGLNSSERTLVSRMIIRQSQGAHALAHGEEWEVPHRQRQRCAGESLRPNWIQYVPSLQAPFLESREPLPPWSGHDEKP